MKNPYEYFNEDKYYLDGQDDLENEELEEKEDELCDDDHFDGCWYE